MKMEMKYVKCALCQKESDQLVVVSNMIVGEPDLDMRPAGSMSSSYAAIQECPFCHYCNYDITQFIQQKYMIALNPLEVWNDDDGIQTIIDNEDEEGPRKFLILAEQYYQEGEESLAQELLIKAYWSSTKKENKEVFLKRAMEIYETSKIEDEIKKYLQLADLNRQLGILNKALNFLQTAKSLYKNLPEDTSTESYNFFDRCFSAEDYLIAVKDINPHNLSEF